MNRPEGRRSEWTEEELTEWEAESEKRLAAHLQEVKAKQEADPVFQAQKARRERLEAEGWQSLSSAPKDYRTTLLLMCEDDVAREGILTPYWCGSDCPCTDPSDDSASTMYAMFGKENCEPECWTLAGIEPLATHWKFPEVGA